MNREKMPINYLLEQLAAMVTRGGPEPDEYDWLAESFRLLQGEGILPQQIAAVYAPTMCLNCLHGRAFLKPRGYAGDFELIDHIYTGWLSSDTSLVRHDRFFHSQPAPRAVRNRKAYLRTVLLSLANSAKQRPLRVLNIGSGPARDVFEFFREFPDAPLFVHCVDIDRAAIEYGADLCSDYKRKVSFEKRNALRLQPTQTYDLIWSAGLFDYLSDRAFIMLARRLFSFVANGGELIIGNFAPSNPTRAPMELLCQWFLEYRSADQLCHLVAAAGITKATVNVDREPEGINLFLRVGQDGDALIS